jgi:hypothetical protein
MIVKFLYTKGPNGHFPALSYNTGKMDKNKGELMKAANFGPLQGLSELRPQDYRNYLKMASAVNKTVKKPQFHVAISCEGKEYDKQQLTDIASQWMERMGYGSQPYLIVFHNDTNNNHVHIVSTRIRKDGKKIKDSYEQIKGQQQMNIVLGIDSKHNAQTDLEKALAYRVQTKAQFLMILESMGYSHKEDNGKLILFKFGRQQFELELTSIENRLVQDVNESRRKQLTALFHKYAALHSTSLTKNHGTHRSDFSAWMKDKMGIELVFHASGDKAPYGYSIIDHAGLSVFKGGDIMRLNELLEVPSLQYVDTNEFPGTVSNYMKVGGKQRQYYAGIFKAVLHNYPDIVQGLHHQGLTLTRRGDDFELCDPGSGVVLNAVDLLDGHDRTLMAEQFSQSTEISREVYRQHTYLSGVSISDDIDDEAIHGRNRRRKKKARTNHR